MTNKISVVLLGTAAIYGLLTILLLYSNFLRFPPTLETVNDLKYALGFFYLPLVMVVLAVVALVTKLLDGSKIIAQICVQLGLIISVGLTVWWLAFESGLLPAMLLSVIFLFGAIRDHKEKKQN